MDLLRFITVGSVDDGKSTLIGRLLYDSESIPEDQLASVKQASKNTNQEIDLALLTDGLKAEREQGITIDVAYRYFHTAKRKFIIIDAPGHVQYTRNMVTGASNAQVALILIDARKGVIEQTRRHSFIADLLGIEHFLVCINKMDLVDYKEETYRNIIKDYQKLAEKFKPKKSLDFVPISALNGDNLVQKSQKMDWYKGQALLEILENIDIKTDETELPARFQVQYVIRPQSPDYPDYRGYAGRILSGTFTEKQEVTVLPSEITTRIDKIEFAQNDLETASAPLSVVLHLENDIDLSRGEMIVPADKKPAMVQSFQANICWMENQKLEVGKRYLIQQGSSRVVCKVQELLHKVDIHTLENQNGIENFELNDIGLVQFRTAQALALDTYEADRNTGCFILIDEGSNMTVAAGMVESIS